MKTLVGALALVLALPISFDVAAHGGGGGGGHGGGGGGGHGGGFHGGAFHGGFHGGGFHHGGFHHGGFHDHDFDGGVFIGGWPYWDDDWGYSGYGDDYYDYPDYAPADGAAPSWYYCHNPAGYYPYVQNCTGGWQPVSPVPPGTLPSTN